MAKVGSTPPSDDDDLVDNHLVNNDLVDDEADDELDADELDADDVDRDEVGGQLDDDDDDIDGAELDDDAALVPANGRLRGRAGVMDKELSARTKDVKAKELAGKGKDAKNKAKLDAKSVRAGRDAAAGPAAWFQSAVRFLREIVAEMRKVIWPSRQELITYTIVVVIFVVILVSIVAGLDIGFAKLTLWVFG